MKSKAEELPALTAKVVDALRGGSLVMCHGDWTCQVDGEANGLDFLVHKFRSEQRKFVSC